MTLAGIDVFSGEAVRVDVRGAAVRAVEHIPAGPGAAPGDLPYLAPGFIDIQVNGYRGCDYSDPDFAPQHLRRIVAELAAAGVGRHFPTIITGPGERTVRNLKVIAETLEAEPELRAAVPGIHLEGPFISSEDGPRGAHDSAFVRDPDWQELLGWQEAAGGLVRLLTLAPECPGAMELIRRATAAGIRVALGHTAAEPAVIAEAVQAGASLSTHLGNGSHSMIPRLCNYIWEQLACDELHASIVTDGFHLPDAVIRSFWRTKGAARIILTSDVAVMGGNPPGVYRWGGIDVNVFPDGHLGLAGTEYLAGAAFLLDWDIPRCIAASGCSLAEAVAACTVNPATYFGLDAGTEPPASSSGAAGIPAGPTAGLRPGATAELVLFRWQPGEQRLAIERTIRGGRVVFPAAL